MIDDRGRLGSMVRETVDRSIGRQDLEAIEDVSGSFQAGFRFQVDIQQVDPRK